MMPKTYSKYICTKAWNESVILFDMFVVVMVDFKYTYGVKKYKVGYMKGKKND